MTEINRVDVRTLKFWLDSNQAIIIDVREPDEYKEGHIKGAINIPLSQILTEIDHVDGCRDKKIVIISCLTLQLCQRSVRQSKGSL